ncbi:hypothetical protein CJ030_MR1G006866 [Morella rubra]|uniref:Thionin-like protein 2 n=1 Tax=Morella rubra TaxID=262757 RepID=A0A6A1WRW8_9ROSI|nr:hypothetical protein CJ030_MR1G006866 [Morella rubra]
MGYKNLALAIILISTMVLTADAEGKKSFSLCTEECMPICMILNRATMPACDRACFLGCQQLQGKGPPGPSSAKE